jgi:thymidine phosphorylase
MLVGDCDVCCIEVYITTGITAELTNGNQGLGGQVGNDVDLASSSR